MFIKRMTTIGIALFSSSTRLGIKIATILAVVPVIPYVAERILVSKS